MAEITKEYLDAKLDALFQKLESNHENTNLQLKGFDEKVTLRLDKIQEQVTRTNGRVTVLEEKPHRVENCPQAEVITKLRDDMIANTAERKYVAKLSGMIATIVSIIVGVVTLIISL